MINKAKYGISILMIFILCSIFIGCMPPESNVEPELDHGLDGKLVISRLYMGITPEGSNKFIAITNISDKPVDLSTVRLVFVPALKDGAVYNLPKSILSPGKTLWCLNGFGMTAGWESKFPIIAGMPEVDLKNPASVITEDSVWYGIKGYYTTNSISLGQEAEGKIDIFDTAPACKKPCAYLRSFDVKASKDLGWFTLKWDLPAHRVALENGSLVGTPDIKPISPAPDYDLSGGNKPSVEVDKGDKKSNDNATKLADNIHLGYPEINIKQDPTNENHFLIERDCYVLSYNRGLHNPNWVSWHLQKEDMKSGRNDVFHHEYRLPESWNEILGDTYSGSGFSRGHMCSNAERNGNGTVYDTFSMANMLPQTQGNNGGPWGGVEDYLRKECKGNMEAYIIAGGYGSGGIGRNGNYRVKTIKDSNGLTINVPEVVWKVVILMERNDDGPDKEKIEANYKNPDKVKVFAVWMPNDETKCKENDKTWRQHVKTIDFVEEMTGYDFFSELDDTVEDYLEALSMYSVPNKSIDWDFDTYNDAA